MEGLCCNWQTRIGRRYESVYCKRMTCGFTQCTLGRVFVRMCNGYGSLGLSSCPSQGRRSAGSCGRDIAFNKRRRASVASSCLPPNGTVRLLNYKLAAADDEDVESLVHPGVRRSNGIFAILGPRVRRRDSKRHGCSLSLILSTPRPISKSQVHTLTR